MLHESVHCVVTSCENRVTWRRVLHLTMENAHRESGADEGQTEGLIADVSIYLCDQHHPAVARIDDAEQFPPETAENIADEDEAEL